MEHEHGSFKVYLPVAWPFGAGNERKLKMLNGRLPKFCAD
jgi:hypothetical protein